VFPCFEYFEPTNREMNRETPKNGRTLALQVSEVLAGCYNHTTKV
jgi:hypothetical protein